MGTLLAPNGAISILRPSGGINIIIYNNKSGIFLGVPFRNTQEHNGDYIPFQKLQTQIMKNSIQ